MKKLLTTHKNLLIYSLLFFIIFSTIIYLFNYDKKNDTRQQYSAYDVPVWTDYSVTESISKTIIKGTITIDDSIGNILNFYSVHQIIYVYVDGALIYQYPVVNNNLFSETPGYCWNFIELPNEINNIEIVIESPYEAYLSQIPDFYIGNALSLQASIVNNDIFQFIICIAMFVCGAVLIVYHLVLVKSGQITGKLLKLGLFSLVLSLWSINECNMTVLLIRNSIITSYISFMSLMLLPYLFAKFVQTFYDDKHPIWTIFYTCDVIQIAFSLVMMYLHMGDLRETLWATHIMLLFIAIIVVYRSYALIKDNVLSHNVKTHLICILICIMALVFDMVEYYIGSSDNNRFGRIGFFLYILVLGMSSMRESISLMKKGQEAITFQKLAYTDQMTGISNRTCFNKDFEILSHKPNGVGVIDFDLNNLKKVNDTYGHSAGDKYITTCASIIHDIFEGIGVCYRVGGDEFVVLIENAANMDIKHYLAMLESSVDDANKNIDYFQMQIAYGFTVFDVSLDKNLEDTYNRADKCMYKNKEDKKTIHRR